MTVEDDQVELVTPKQLYDAVMGVHSRVGVLAERQDHFATRLDKFAERQSGELSEIKTELGRVAEAANDSAHVMGDQIAGIAERITVLELPWKALRASIQFSTSNWQFVAMAVTAAAGVWAYLGFPVFPMPY